MLKIKDSYIPGIGGSMTIRKEFDAWKKSHPDQHGPKAYQRFVMMKFLERVTQSEDFVFKGGNLLWFYIQTPRPTKDLDLSTITETDSDAVIAFLKSICVSEGGLTFSLLGHKVVSENGKIGLAVTIGHEDDQGARNKFGVDIVLGVPTDIQQIQINRQLINAASIENIIIDKLSACYQFRGGNTRAKDYDDLLRISEHASEVDKEKFLKLCKIRGVTIKELDYNWLPGDLSEAWADHVGYDKSKYLPRDIGEVFAIINDFIKYLIS